MKATYLPAKETVTVVPEQIILNVSRDELVALHAVLGIRHSKRLNTISLLCDISDLTRSLHLQGRVNEARKAAESDLAASPAGRRDVGGY